MKRIATLLLGLVLSSPLFATTTTPSPWVKSPALEKLIVQLKQYYTEDDLTRMRQESLTQVDNLSYFIRFNDKPDTPEYKLLKAYLWGVQQSHIQSINQQIQTNITPWFCPTGGKLRSVSPNAKNPTQFIENVLWQALERDLKTMPDRYQSYDGAAAFASVSGIIAYGLQTQMPCYEHIPTQHQMGGFNY